MPHTKTLTKRQRTTPETAHEEGAWYDLIPYSYGILEPGEWFWLTHRYLPPEVESDAGRTDDKSPTPATHPTIRITFHARK